MSAHHCGRSESQCARLRPLLPHNPGGGLRGEGRRVRSGLRGRAAPACYGPHKTRYNRCGRWSKAGVFDRLFQALGDRERHARDGEERGAGSITGGLRAGSDAHGAGSTRSSTRSATRTANP